MVSIEDDHRDDPGFGKLNRKLKASVAGVARGEKGAISRSLDLARKRERLMNRRWSSAGRQA